MKSNLKTFVLLTIFLAFIFELIGISITYILNPRGLMALTTMDFVGYYALSMGISFAVSAWIITIKWKGDSTERRRSGSYSDSSSTSPNGISSSSERYSDREDPFVRQQQEKMEKMWNPQNPEDSSMRGMVGGKTDFERMQEQQREQEQQ